LIIKVQITNKGRNDHYKIIKRQIESVPKNTLSIQEKIELRIALTEFVNGLIKTGELNEELFLKIIKLSPRTDDSSLLNKMIADIEVWKSYKEDFDEEVNFPVGMYYSELIKVI